MGLFLSGTRLFSAMSKIEEIEQAVEQLPLKDFAKLAAWIDQRCQQLAVLSCLTLPRSQ
jgi:hypothetical protein